MSLIVFKDLLNTCLTYSTLLGLVGPCSWKGRAPHCPQWSRAELEGPSPGPELLPAHLYPVEGGVYGDTYTDSNPPPKGAFQAQAQIVFHG